LLPAVLAAGRAVAGAERLDAAAGDDHQIEPRGKRRVGDRAVRPLDGDPGDARPRQAPSEHQQAGLGVLDREPLESLAVLVDDAHRVRAARPVDASMPDGRIHACLLAVPAAFRGTVA
jgi:hypothetical protein